VTARYCPGITPNKTGSFTLSSGRISKCRFPNIIISGSEYRAYTISIQRMFKVAKTDSEIHIGNA
jgi:hypothetical protein